MSKEIPSRYLEKGSGTNGRIANGVKLVGRWLVPEDGVEKMINEVAVEQFLNGLLQERRIWVGSHHPETPESVAQLTDSYNTAHNQLSTESRKPRYQQHKRDQTSRTPTGDKETPQANKDDKLQVKTKDDQWMMLCVIGARKRHFAQNCTEENYYMQEKQEQVRLFRNREVNGQTVQRIWSDSRVSRTVVDRRWIPLEDFEKEAITVTFGNGTFGKYPLAPVQVIFDGEEYQVKAVIVKGLYFWGWMFLYTSTWWNACQ